MSERRAARARHAAQGAAVVELWHAHLHALPWDRPVPSVDVVVRHTTSVLPWCYLSDGERLEHLEHAHGIVFDGPVSTEVASSWHAHAHDVGRYVHAHEHDRAASGLRVRAALARDWRSAGHTDHGVHTHGVVVQGEGDWWMPSAS